MEARLRSWWQTARQRRVAIAATTAIIVIAIILIIVGYRFDWAGFNGYTQVSTIHILSGPTAGTVTRTEVYQPGKTLWDWLQLLIIPLALAIIAILFNRAERKNEQRVASDNQQETALQEYIKEMSELLLHGKLRESQPGDEVRTIARVRTLTVLPRLDANRKGSVLQFLYESGLIEKGRSIVDLSYADLSSTNLNAYDLSGADLSKVNLREAKLFLANLSGTNLHLATLTAANLYQANLRGANLEKAFLDGGADLSFADLSGANLQGTILKGTNLRGSNVTPEQLDKATFFEGVTMPDGSIYP